MSKFFKALVTAAAAIAVITVGLLAVNVATVGADPGDGTDPIVTKSYVDQRISEIMTVIGNSAGSGTGGNISTADSEAMMAQIEYAVRDYVAKNGTASAFTPVSVSAGQTIYGGTGTEIILRTGAGTIVTTTDGVVNVTTAKDMKNGAAVAAGNLLVIPREDGRGIKVTANAWFLVKGSYTIR